MDALLCVFNNYYLQVVDRRCKPLAGANIDVWYAGADGRYCTLLVKKKGIHALSGILLGALC